MIKNYLKIAFRNLVRDRSYAILNLLGLSVGLASVIMIVAYVRYELSYDKSYSNHSRVYRLLQEKQNGAEAELGIHTPVGLAATFQKEFPGIAAYTLFSTFPMQCKSHNEIVSLKAIEGSSNYFNIFNFKLLKGDAGKALDDPGSCVVTETTANKLFNGKDPIGQVITDNHGKQLHVTGLIADIPANTHFSGDIIISLSGQQYISDPLTWRGFVSMPQYLLLDKNTDARQLENHFSSIYKKYSFPKTISIHLQPVTDIHLKSHTTDEIGPNSDIKYIYIFASAALLILFIACINYINLTTARSLQRAKEIGLRKVLGAMKMQLVIQFLTESFLFFFISTVAALVIAAIAWPLFSTKVTADHLMLPLFDGKNIAAVALIFVLGVLAGAYPAFFLLSIHPAKILRGLSKFGINLNIRKALVVLQFTISGVLIISTIVIYQQLAYVNNVRLGFNKDHLITVPFYIHNADIVSFRNELRKNPGVRAVATGSFNAGERYGSTGSMNDLADTIKQVTYQFIDCDQNFLKTMGMKLIAGRDFSADHANDFVNRDPAFKKVLSSDEYNRQLESKSIILNQQAVAALGLTNPVGKVVKTAVVKGIVIGVVQDFNGLSLHQKIPPVVMRCEYDQAFGHLYISVSGQNTQRTISYIESQWKKFYPDNRFDFTFVDEKLQQLYTADTRMSALFSAFASLAILIGCLGLFGLVSLTVQNRVKEIGIRKVLGASVIDITRLLSADFIKLVIFSFIISSPLAWYFINNWLQSFAYRVDVHWWVFLIAFVVAIVISLATLSFQSVRAAIANPVDSLRSE